jgi:hypothetical protein
MRKSNVLLFLTKQPKAPLPETVPLVLKVNLGDLLIMHFPVCELDRLQSFLESIEEPKEKQTQ